MRFFVFFLVTAVTSPLIATGQSVAAKSPAQQRVAAAEKKVQADPKSWQSYDDLAFALCRKARDSGDVALYDRAEMALQHSFQLSPGNYAGRKLHVTVLLGKHEFAQALRLATELNRRVHDDIGGWGLLVDANIAVGNYVEAERDAQWILDLRRGSALGFEKAAELRELFGDFEGAIEFFKEASLRTSQNDADQRGWLLMQEARLETASGNLKRAGELLDQAFKLYPDSQLAIAIEAKLRMAQTNYAEAASLLQRRYQTVPSPANLYEWAEALGASGRKEQALAAFQDFEAKARAEITKPYNSNLELIYFYTDHKSNPAEALALATKESAVRHDSARLDAFAWALYRNGRYAEAKRQMDRALAVGIRDPLYFCHAARIAAMANDTAGASRFRKELAGMGGNACPVESPMQSALGAVP